MKEGFIKYIIIALVAFFSVTVVYANTDYSKPIWNTNPSIGYELDSFNPTKVDTVNDNHEWIMISKQFDKRINDVKKKHEKIEINASIALILSILQAMSLYCF